MRSLALRVVEQLASVTKCIRLGRNTSLTVVLNVGRSPLGVDTFGGPAAAVVDRGPRLRESVGSRGLTVERVIGHVGRPTLLVDYLGLVRGEVILVTAKSSRDAV